MNEKEQQPKQPDESKRTRSILRQPDNNWRIQSRSRTLEDQRGLRGQSTSRTFFNWRMRRAKDGAEGVENKESANRNGNYQIRFVQNRRKFAQAEKSPAIVNELEKLARENPDVLIKKLSCEGFSQLLYSDHHIVVIMKIMARVCSSDSSASRTDLLRATCKDDFWENLKKFILTLPYQSGDERKECRYWENAGEFWTNVLTYCTTLLDVIPATACDVLQKLLTRVTCTLENLEEISDNVKSSFEDLQVALNKCREETKRRKDIKQVVKPPDDFRNIDVYPTCAEITTTEKTFLRRNVIEGAYDSVEHYLDVQFRLLREDFVAPLRKGVFEYLTAAGDSCKKLQNVKVHPRVRFLRHELVNGTRAVLLCFNQSPRSKINYHENSRRFMFGALLCFTRDNFKSLLFGKIVNQDAALLQKGLLAVVFENDFSDYVFNVDYLMVECKVYFEPYYHVLNALQSMTEWEFPMKEYLVDVTRQVEYPDYYNRASSHKLMIGRWYEANVATNSWPEAGKLRLNDSQYSAFKNALSQKFVVIQGPPGTGKTYVGLLIAKILLYNSRLWRSGGPMLVVAYTNHALDQFLEGLLPTTSNIVRIGGQSKNEKLEKFNIKVLRQSTRDKGAKKTFWLMHTAVENQLRILKRNYAALQTIDKYEGIVDLSSFLNERPELSGTWFQFATAENIGNWLLGKEFRRGTHPQQINLAAAEQVLQSFKALRIEDSTSKANEEEVFDNVNRAEHRFDLDDFNVTTSSDGVAYIVKTESLSQKIRRLAHAINFITLRKDEGDLDVSIEDSMKLLNKMGFRLADEEDILACCALLEKNLKQARVDLSYLEMCMNQGRSADLHVEPVEGDFHSPENIAPDDRWRWYFYWFGEYKKRLNRRTFYLEEQYHELYQEYEELRTREDIKIMKSRLVVGMTTTSAARLQASLQVLKCPIVIVEEAAEILEAHTVASLTKKCQHLILIGDHQQLRPSTADYNIEKNFFLGISLFERMIMNGVQNNMLDVQHRMRPEIAKLIVPAIYPELKNHESVETFPMVGGVLPCLYFVTHRNQEEVSGDSSKTNLHEAKFLLQLARYLILNGYAPEDITILAAYSGQMFTLLNERKHVTFLTDERNNIPFLTHERNNIPFLTDERNNIPFLTDERNNIPFLAYEREDVRFLDDEREEDMILWSYEQENIAVPKDVRITTLDNYQGEESKIILLSLVRNNDEGSIGFLAIENRVCVALSRAKEGFYMMGNIDLLTSRSQVWQKVNQSLQAQNAVGTSLALRCQNHPSTITRIETAGDFERVPEGGCNEKCGQILECGHSCNVKCHYLDREHTAQYNCKKKCERFACGNNHPCPKLCFEDCGSCMFLVSKLLPCGHEQAVACHLDPKDHNCAVLVLSELPCGHEVNKPCYRDVKTYICPRPCNTQIERCGHVCRSRCHFGKDPNHLQEYKCKEKCEKYGAGCTVKTIEHLCPLNCVDECRPCKIAVKKTRNACSHFFSVACNVDVDAMPCLKPCKKKLPCGHPCKLTCSETCGKCQVIVEKTLPECNHKVTVRCSEDPTRTVCKGKCPRLLPCGHPCSTTCKEKCTEKCQTLIESPFEADCGHTFKIPCYLRNEGLASNDRKLLTHCREPCATKLECGHTCSGTCSECLQGRIHKCCAEKCTNFLICGHECSLSCRQVCHPCTKPYLYECVHSKLRKTCGELPTSCKYNCPRNCKHVICTAKCSDKCVVPPCSEPCKKILKCGHSCIGFCNDPCPPLCRVCNKGEFTQEIILGFEEDGEEARFVLLKECGHVIESRAMERWLQSDGDLITNKRCPTCHTSLSFTRRYGDYIKESFANILEVKWKFYGNFMDKQEMQVELLRKLDVTESTRLELVSRQCLTTRLKLQQQLQSLKHTMRLKFSSTLLKMLSSKIQIYQQVCELFHKSIVTHQSAKCISYVDLLLETLIKEESCFTTQGIQDFERELMRLRRMLQLSEIEEGAKDVEAFTDPRTKELYKSLLDRLYSAKKYKVEGDSKIKERLTELARKVSFQLDMSDVELKEIDKIAGGRRGVWFKCPKGHLYAVVRSEETDQMPPTCNECVTNE